MKYLGILLMIAGPSMADTVVSTHTVRAQSVLQSEDLILKAGDVAGAYSEIASVVGLEARVALYPGRPIRLGDVGPPAIVERNQIIIIVYANAGLSIHTEGRALDRAGVGDRMRAMNLSSRTTVFGRVQPDGSISVSD